MVVGLVVGVVAGVAHLMPLVDLGLAARVVAGLL